MPASSEFSAGVLQERERVIALFERFIDHCDTFGKPDFKHILEKMKKEVIEGTYLREETE